MNAEELARYRQRTEETHRRHETVVLLQPVQAIPARRWPQAAPGREAVAVPWVY